MVAEKWPERQASWVVTPPPDRSDISDELFGAYKKEYLEERKTIQEEAWYSLEALKRWLKKILPSSVEKRKEPLYDPLKLSQLGKKYLDANHEKLKLENPETTTILIYLQWWDGRKSEARYLSIPRTNPTNKPIPVDGFTFTPTPKSNGYNTEYSITGPGGEEWTQLAVFFPGENPKYKRKRELEVRLAERKNSQQQKQRELQALKPTKKNLPQRQALAEEIRKLGIDIVWLSQKIAIYAKEEKYTHFSYIPYREGLDSKENRTAWLGYLSKTMQSTYNYRLDDGTTLAQMKSNAPWLTIWQAVPWQFPLILNIVERMDFEDYFDSGTKKILLPKTETDPMMRRQIGRSLTTFWVNKEDAFNWQRSRVWAQGVGQLMPDTYRDYWSNKKYGVLFPEEDFDIASRDHETSFRLQISHFDDQIYQFPSEIKKNWGVLIADPSTRTGIIAILAAGYNGSMSRIIKEVFGDDKKMSLDDCRKKLSLSYITTAMEVARDQAIQKVKDQNQPRKVRNPKTKKFETLPPLPLSKDQLAEVQRYWARYKESMTYVLKADFVWKHLKEEYPKTF